MDVETTQLISDARAGDRHAFDLLVRKFDKRIFQIIHRIVGNLHDAQDVYQETFLSAVTGLESFHFQAEFSTWLTRIAINKSLNKRRRSKIRQWLSLDQNEFPASSETTDNLVLKKDLNKQIEKALDLLSNMQRTVFILKHLQGYKIKEIAALLERQEGTIKNALFRATEKLRQHIKETETNVNINS